MCVHVLALYYMQHGITCKNGIDKIYRIMLENIFQYSRMILS